MPRPKLKEKEMKPILEYVIARHGKNFIDLYKKGRVA